MHVDDSSTLNLRVSHLIESQTVRSEEERNEAVVDEDLEFLQTWTPQDRVYLRGSISRERQ